MIENGIDTGRFQHSEENRSRYRRVLGLNSELVFLFAGRWARAKGLDVLLRAMSSSALDGRQFHLVILGDRTPDEPGLIEEFIPEGRNNRRLSVIGPVDDLPGFLNAADVFVMPSRFEGMPLAFLEALATGLPVLASDIPIHLEIASKTAAVWTFRSEDPVQLASVMARIIDNWIPGELRGSARQAAVSLYSLDRMIDEYLRLYSYRGR